MSYTLRISTTFTDTTNCCGGATTCYLTMPTVLIDGGTTNYANSTAATAAIAAQAVGCLIEVIDNTVGTKSAVITSGKLVVSDATGGAMGGVYLCFFSLSASGSLKVDYSISTDATGYHIAVAVYQSDGTTLVGNDTTVTTSGGTLSVSVSSAGTYFAFLSYNNRESGNGTFFTAHTTVYSNVGITFCGVRAAYDDGVGGTAYVICV